MALATAFITSSLMFMAGMERAELPALTGEVTALVVVPIVAALKVADRRPVRLVIDSPGGSVDEGLYLMSAIKAHGLVTCTVRGAAASIAAVVLQACARREATPDSQLLFHQISTLVRGDALALRHEAERLWLSSMSLALMACQRQDQLERMSCARRMMATWALSAKDALRWGLLDAVVP